MPRQAKRARQKAARAARLAELERQRKRQASIRRGVVIVFVVAIGIGIAALAGAFSSGKSAASTTTTAPKSSTSSTTTSTTTASSAADKAAQTAADAIAVKAGCPSDPDTKLDKDSWKTAPKMTIDTSATYLATVKTDVGTFVITLEPKLAPIAVNSFVFLAKHDFYNCVIFHRVIPGFVVQGGDPTGTGDGGPGYEYTESGPATASPQYPLGSVAMANSNSPATHTPTTNGSQFFIVTGSSGESLPADYVLFGKVTSGMSVVDKINDDGSSSGVPPDVTHRMLSVTISEVS